jgi:hypothetical protein
MKTLVFESFLAKRDLIEYILLIAFVVLSSSFVFIR